MSSLKSKNEVQATKQEAASDKTKSTDQKNEFAASEHELTKA